MKIEDYSTLKAASKVAFSKVAEDGMDKIKLTEKRFNSITGEAADDFVDEVQLASYEAEKIRYTADKARITKEITQLTAIISDIKAL
jgi:hypothetical protein